MVLEALQLAAEDKASRLRRYRVAKRGGQAALELPAREGPQEGRGWQAVGGGSPHLALVGKVFGGGDDAEAASVKRSLA